MKKSTQELIVGAIRQFTPAVIAGCASSVACKLLKDRLPVPDTIRGKVTQKIGVYGLGLVATNLATKAVREEISEPVAGCVEFVTEFFVEDEPSGEFTEADTDGDTFSYDTNPKGMGIDDKIEKMTIDINEEFDEIKKRLAESLPKRKYTEAKLEDDVQP